MAIPSEHSEQRELVKRLRRRGILLAAVPNGAHLRGGGRAAAQLKAEGLSPGVPDLLIFDPPTELEILSEYERDLVGALQALSPAARARVLAMAQCGPGACIELKKSDGGREPSGSAVQRRWGALLRARGWSWGVAHGWRGAVEQLQAWGYKL